MLRRLIPAALLTMPMLSSCVSHDEPRDPLTENVVIPTQIPAQKDWDNLSKETRHAVLEGDYRSIPGMTLTPRQPLADVKDPAQRQLANTMAAYMRKNGEIVVNDPHHARIGSLKTWVEFLLITPSAGAGSAQLAGGRVAFEQEGCDLPDDSARAFPTAAAAKAAGCTGDGKWTASGSFNHDGSPFEYADFMSWSDH